MNWLFTHFPLQLWKQKNFVVKKEEKGDSRKNHRTKWHKPEIYEVDFTSFCLMELCIFLTNFYFLILFFSFFFAAERVYYKKVRKQYKKKNLIMMSVTVTQHIFSFPFFRKKKRRKINIKSRTTNFLFHVN